MDGHGNWPPQTNQLENGQTKQLKKSLKTSIGAAVLCCVASLVSTASAQNGTWSAYPGQSTTYETAVQQPINADGTSKFKGNGNAVIPVKFALSQGTGPFVFESIGSDNPGVDYSYLSFTVNPPVTFNDITELSAAYSFTEGNCHGGSLRWQVRVDLGGGKTPAVFIYYGDYPSFTDGTTQSGTNLIGMSDLRYDTSQIPGGAFYDSYAHAQTLIGTAPIIRATLMLDSGWGGDQRVSLTSATVATSTYTETFTPQPESSMTPIRPTSQALFGISKIGVTPPGVVNEPVTIQPRDSNGIFRIVDGKYMYNLATSSLMGAGTYNVYATIDGTTLLVAGFDLK